MSKAEQIWVMLNQMDQKQFFHYVKSKIQELVDSELQLDVPTRCFKTEGQNYLDDLQRLKSRLDLVNLDVMPVNGYELIAYALDLLDKNDEMFLSAHIPLDLFQKKYVGFKEMTTDQVKKGALRQFNPNKLIAVKDENEFFILFFEKNASLLTPLFEKLNSQSDPEKTYVFYYQIIEILLEHAVNVLNKKMSLYAFLSKEEINQFSEFEFKQREEILFRFYDKIKSDIKSLVFTQEGVSLTDTHLQFPEKCVVNFAHMQSCGVSYLVSINDRLGELLLEDKLNEFDILQSRKIKVLITKLQSLDCNIEQDRDELMKLFKYIIFSPFLEKNFKDPSLLFPVVTPPFLNAYHNESSEKKLEMLKKVFQCIAPQLLSEDFLKIDVMLLDGCARRMQSQLFQPSVKVKAGLYGNTLSPKEVDQTPPSSPLSKN